MHMVHYLTSFIKSVFVAATGDIFPKFKLHRLETNDRFCKRCVAAEKQRARKLATNFINAAASGQTEDLLKVTRFFRGK